MQIKYIPRAFRLPFICASALPFIFGSLINKGAFNFLNFLLGLSAVVATHLSANLINDYADAKSGADAHDRTFYGFFGGSKLIQEGKVSEKAYLQLAIFCAVAAILCVIILSLLLRSVFVIVIYSIVIVLSWQYSQKPLRFSYRRLGEVFIFFLFGPALVMGGYFIQAGIFPELKSFILSVPFGLFTTAILFANEVPDFATDIKSGKFTWVSLIGDKNAYLFYLLLESLAFICIGLFVVLGYLKLSAFLSLVFILPVIKAAGILRRFFSDKSKLTESSKLTISVQTGVSIILILGIWL